MGGRRVIGVLLCAATLAVVGGATAASGAGEGPVSVTVGNGLPIFGGSFSPKALSRTTPQPVTLNIEASLRALDGSTPPAIREARIELDRSAVFDLAGREGTVVGRGELEFEVLDGLETVRHAPFNIYGGIVRGGVRVLPVAIGPRSGIGASPKLGLRKVVDGRYGYELRLSVPPSIEDRIRITRLDFRLGDVEAANPDRRGVVSARCRDGKLQIHAATEFADGTQSSEEITRACTPKP